MEIATFIFTSAYVIVFLTAVFLSLKFEFSKESKDERGKTILNMSYRYAFPLFLIGWLALELYNEYIGAIGYETYKLAIWLLLTTTIIIQAMIVTVARRIY